MNENKRRNFFFSDELFEQLRKHAERMDTTMSEVLRTALVQYLERTNATHNKQK